MKPSLAPLFAAAFAVGATSVNAAEAKQWRFDASANLFMSALSGDVTARGIPAEVDLSFSDLVDDLEFGAAGRFTIGYDRWSLSTEVSYVGLGSSTRLASIDLDQWLVEPSVAYRVDDWLEVFAGARYNNLNGEIRFRGPLGKVSTGTQDWWDPIVGANLRLPLGKSKFSLAGRFDIGGFGAGSDLTWQAFPYLNWQFAKWGSAQLGYRWLGTDYEDGSGPNKFVYDVTLQGPQLGFTMHF